MDGARDITLLQITELLVVEIAHDLIVAGMIQADCVSDLMSQGVSDVVDLQIAVEADLPALEGIEADQRLCDRLNVLWRVGIISDVSECPALWLELCANEDVCSLGVPGFAKCNIGGMLPHVERGSHFSPYYVFGEL